MGLEIADVKRRFVELEAKQMATTKSSSISSTPPSSEIAL